MSVERARELLADGPRRPADGRPGQQGLPHADRRLGQGRHLRGPHPPRPDRRRTASTCGWWPTTCARARRSTPCRSRSCWPSATWSASPARSLRRSQRRAVPADAVTSRRRVPAAKAQKWLVAAAVVAVVVAAFVAYSFSETYRIEVKEYTFTSPDVPAAFDGTRIVLLTDIHRAFFFSQERVGRLVDRVNALDARPDRPRRRLRLRRARTTRQSAFAELGRLKAPLGTLRRARQPRLRPPRRRRERPGAGDRGHRRRGHHRCWTTAGCGSRRSGQRFRLAGVSDLQQGHPQAAPALEGTSAERPRPARLPRARLRRGAAARRRRPGAFRPHSRRPGDLLRPVGARRALRIRPEVPDRDGRERSDDGDRLQRRRHHLPSPPLLRPAADRGDHPARRLAQPTPARLQPLAARRAAGRRAATLSTFGRYGRSPRRLGYPFTHER